jgi:predicted permease
VRLPWLFSRGRARREEELDEELRAHLRMAEEERVAGGESPDSAAASARREFGNVALVREITREAWGGVRLEHLAQDIRFGLRQLRREPGFAILAILCLTIGIGANAAVYGWIEGILLRPYPAVAHQESLFALAGTARGTPDFDVISWPDFVDLRRSGTLYEPIAEKITGTTLSIGDRAERVPGSLVSANYFDALGVKPFLGRGFEPAEETGRNAHPVTVISYQLWKRRFNADPAILGKPQRMNGVLHTIVGVAPEGFFGTFVGYAFQFWVPVSMQETFESNVYKREDRGQRWIEGFVRLKPGATLGQAQEEISATAKRLESDYPTTNLGRGIRLLPLWRSPFNNAGALLPTLRVALGVALVLLLIACANVGNLLLVRSFARRQEMTVRVAIGAGGGRLAAQLLVESLILSVFAVIGGLVAAFWLRNALVLLIPPRGTPMSLTGRIDGRVLAVSIGVCVLATVLVGLVPAIQARRIDLAGALRSESGSVSGPGRRSRLRSSLVVVQVSLSFLLLVGAGLLLRSMQRIRDARPGFATDDVLTTGIDLASAGYDRPRAKLFQDALIERARAIPGVGSAALSRTRPFGYRPYSSAPIEIDGYLLRSDEQPTVEFNEVSPSYFATAGIPLVSGREFTRDDDEGAMPVAIVNEAMVADYFRGEDPVDRTFRVHGRPVRVIGVARQSNYETLLEPPKPFFYVPLRQSFSASATLYLRTSGQPGTVAAALAREIQVLDRNLAPSELITMREQVQRSAAPQRVAVSLLGVFGAVALLLAAIGLYGVVSHAVSQSERELGLRMALGAAAPDLMRYVMSQGLRLAAAGVLLGAAAAAGLTRLLGYLLYRVGPRDPLVFGAACLLMMAAALAACLVPAWRAMRTDPVEALRG